MKQQTTLEQLFNRYCNGACTAKERADLFRQLGDNQNQQLLKSLIREELLNEDAPEVPAGPEEQEALDSVFRKIKSAISKTKPW